MHSCFYFIFQTVIPVWNMLVVPTMYMTENCLGMGRVDINVLIMYKCNDINVTLGTYITRIICRDAPVLKIIGSIPIVQKNILLNANTDSLTFMPLVSFSKKQIYIYI